MPVLARDKSALGFFPRPSPFFAAISAGGLER